ncbi:MAG: hypothetical protein MK212_17820 [Saprospiraceae bacterium]|nr:hypothetical protein [Saprospiraceae bacterium]
MFTAIIAVIGSIVSGTIGAVSQGKERKHQEQMAVYEATKFKQLYEPKRSYTTVILIVLICIGIAFLSYLILKKDHEK